MKVAVRLDDITPDMDWERFLKFKALLDKYQVKPLIGVIPDNQDRNLTAEEKNRVYAEEHPWIKEMMGEDKQKVFAAYVKELIREGWSVAMHGYRHIYTTKKGGLFPLNSFSEFAGLSYEKQKGMLAEGKNLLKEMGIETDLFMAPAHSYDKNTLKALIATGFSALTDGFGEKPYIWQGLAFYPISFKLSNTFQKKHGYSTMVIHTGTVNDEDLKKYECYFKERSVEWISFEEYLNAQKVKRRFNDRVKELFMAKGKSLIAFIKYNRKHA